MGCDGEDTESVGADAQGGGKNNFREKSDI